MFDKIVNPLVLGIIKKIYSGKYSIGSVLPPNEHLEEMYKCTNKECISGITELTKKGYIYLCDNQYYIANWKEEGTLAIIRDQIQVGYFSKETLKSLNEMRMLVEMECIKITSSRCPQEIIQRMENLLDTDDVALSIDQRVENDLSFHHLIVLGSGNSIYPLILTTYESCIYSLAYDFYRNDDMYLHSVRRRKELVESIKSNDVERSQRLLFDILVECELGAYYFFESKIKNGKYIDDK